jgi:hypothetical protein
MNFWSACNWPIVMDANAMEFIHMNVHLWLIVNLYLTLNLVLVHFQFTSTYLLIHFELIIN